MRKPTDILVNAFAEARGRHLTEQEAVSIRNSSFLTDECKELLLGLYRTSPVLESWVTVFSPNILGSDGSGRHWMYFPSVDALLNGLEIIMPKLSDAHSRLVPFSTDASGSGDFYAIDNAEVSFGNVYSIYTDGVLSCDLASSDENIILAFSLHDPDLSLAAE